jgi:hypothetical protein
VASWGAHCAPHLLLSWATPQCRAEAHDTGSVFVHHTHQWPRSQQRSCMPPRPQRRATAAHRHSLIWATPQCRAEAHDTGSAHACHTRQQPPSRSCAATRQPGGTSCTPHYCLHLHQAPWHRAQARDTTLMAHTHDQRPTAAIAPARRNKPGALAAPPATLPNEGVP